MQEGWDLAAARRRARSLVHDALEVGCGLLGLSSQAGPRGSRRSPDTTSPPQASSIDGMHKLFLKSSVQNARDVRVETLHLVRHEDEEDRCLARARCRNVVLVEVLRGQRHGSEITHIPFGDVARVDGCWSCWSIRRVRSASIIVWSSGAEYCCCSSWFVIITETNADLNQNIPYKPDSVICPRQRHNGVDC